MICHNNESRHPGISFSWTKTAIMTKQALSLACSTLFIAVGFLAIPPATMAFSFSLDNNAPVSIDVQNPNRGMDNVLGPYMIKLRKRIQRFWFPNTIKQKRHASASFTLQDTGEVINLKISSPSGDEQFDQSILRAIEESQPYPEQPMRKLAIEVSFDNRFLTQETLDQNYQRYQLYKARRQQGNEAAQYQEQQFNRQSFADQQSWYGQNPSPVNQLGQSYPTGSYQQQHRQYQPSPLASTNASPYSYLPQPSNQASYNQQSYAPQNYIAPDPVHRRTISNQDNSLTQEPVYIPMGNETNNFYQDNSNNANATATDSASSTSFTEPLAISQFRQLDEQAMQAYRTWFLNWLKTPAEECFAFLNKPQALSLTTKAHKPQRRKAK